MTISVVDWVIIVGYLAFALGVGIYFARRAGRSTKEFFISGRNLPWWLAGTSMVATSFASDTPLVVTGWTRKGGIAENWLWWSWAVGGMFSVFLLSRLWRRAEVVTDIELTELRYSGPSAAVLRGFRAAYMALPINSIIMAWVIVAMAKFMTVLFGGLDTLAFTMRLPFLEPVVVTPYVLAIAICIVIAIVYSVLSGFWGVVVTDLVQFVIAMGGAVVLSVLAVRHVGGLSALREQAQAGSALGERLLRFFPRPPDGFTLLQWEFWKTPFFAFLVYISVQWWANKNADGGGVIIQRMSSTRNERASLLATLWFNVAHYAVRPWPWILVALVSIAVLPDLADGECAYPEMVKLLAPPGLMGLIIASFLAAFMSTIDSTLNLSSSYVVNDFYRRFVRRRASERHYVTVSRIASVGFMLLASVIAVMFDSISGLFKFLLAFSSGVGLVYILRWFWWRINAWSEISAMIASSVIAGGIYLLNKPMGWELQYSQILLFTVAGSTAVWVAVTYLTAPVATEKLVTFYRKVRPYGAWGRVLREADVPRTRGLWRLLLSWLAGTVMVLAGTFSVGKFVLGAPREGVYYLTAAVLGAVVVSFEVFRREDRSAA